MPVDSDVFKNMNEVQLLWYYYNILEDEKEKFEMMRDLEEHNAMFSNPDGVRQVRDSRKNSIHISDDDFQSQIEKQFGREFNIGKKEEIGNIEEEFKNKDIDYLDVDLDEISFIPT